MLHIELLSCVLEFIHSALHFFKVRVNLSSILVIHVANVDQTLVKHLQLLLIPLQYARMIKTIAMFILSFSPTISSYANP